MSIAIIGYGSMGREVEAAARLRNIEIASIYDVDDSIIDEGWSTAIEFTQPDSAVANIEKVAQLGKSIVVGTTGWLGSLDYVRGIVEKYGVGLVYGSNYSIGMNMLFKITAFSASLANKFDDFDIMVHEMHHKRKKDSPSGTALTIANLIIDNFPRKTYIADSKIDGAIDSNSLHVSSTRGGEITGRHTIYIDSISDSIELSHRAKNRRGFALGALTAADWVKDKKGVFDFKDILDEIWSSVDS